MSENESRAGERCDEFAAERREKIIEALSWWEDEDGRWGHERASDVLAAHEAEWSGVLATPDADDASERVTHDHTEPRPGCRCAERHALSKGMTGEEAERAAEFFGSLAAPAASTDASGADEWPLVDQHGYDVALCVCEDGSYLGARQAGQPCCCERCGRLTRDQWDYLVSAAATRARAEGAAEALSEAANRIEFLWNGGTGTDRGVPFERSERALIAWLRDRAARIARSES